MQRKILLFFFLVLVVTSLPAQDDDKTPLIQPTDTVSVSSAKTDTTNLPVISYSLNDNKKYAIAEIKVSGVENYGYEDFVLIGISDLTVGQRISVPGPEITTAIKNLWKSRLFSDVAVPAIKKTEDSVWIEIALKPNLMISNINYHGVKKGEREELETQIGMMKNSFMTPNLVGLAKKRMKTYFDGKGFSNADITIRQYDDVANAGKMILDITVDKNEKTKVREIAINGNENLNDYELRMAMKKTNEGFSLRKTPWLNIRKMFSQKKFVEDEYKSDLDNIINKYNEKGYRDAEIVSDSVAQVDDKHVSVYIDVKEGNKYFIRDIVWVGNTVYSTTGRFGLETLLNMQPGDVYNQKKLGERLNSDEDAVASLYYNNGYIFSRLDPVETYVENDSVDLEIRVTEGPQATINKIIIDGNDRIYENIIRRELITKPGQLFSKDHLMNSAREIAQSGHFDPENMDIKPLPDPENGTVDIHYNLTPKANDQVEFSAGWGQTGVIGRLSFKFSNFSFKNMINPSTYKGIIPQGEGQTLTLSGQTNGRYYQSYSVSFLEPWLGGKRPNSLSVGAYYMSTTGVDDRYYQQMAYNPYLYYSGYSGGMAYDENKKLSIFGTSVSFGKRLSWPDYFFNFSTELAYQRYMLKNYGYGFNISNGNSNSITLGLNLSRNSIDNPLYTRRGSQFSLSLNLTPPYSAFDGIDYAGLTEIANTSSNTTEIDKANAKKYKWIEYHKWKFKSKIFIPLANPETVKRTPVLMSRIEYGFLGSYKSNKKSPFETYYMGGDGMTGYSSMYGNETIGLRGYSNGSLGQSGYAYTRLALELRYPVLLEPTSTIYALTFVEAGNLWYNIRDFNPFSLKRSAGFGVRIFLPMIGLMGIDWGYGFDRPTSGSAVSGSQLHFIIGQEF